MMSHIIITFQKNFTVSSRPQTVRKIQILNNTKIFLPKHFKMIKTSSTTHLHKGAKTLPHMFERMKSRTQLQARLTLVRKKETTRTRRCPTRKRSEETESRGSPQI